MLAAPPEEEENTMEFRADDPTLVALQQKMAQLYLKQKEKGGIIDLEEEKNKFLLSSNRVMLAEEQSCNQVTLFGQKLNSFSDAE